MNRIPADSAKHQTIEIAKSQLSRFIGVHLGGCSPGELAQSSKRAAMSAFPALRSRSSFSGPGGMSAAFANLFCERGKPIFERKRLFETLALHCHAATPDYPMLDNRTNGEAARINLR
jgi:hypothetical protein